MEDGAPQTKNALNNTGYFGPRGNPTTRSNCTDSLPNLALSASRAQVEKAMDGHIVGAEPAYLLPKHLFSFTDFRLHLSGELFGLALSG